MRKAWRLARQGLSRHQAPGDTESQRGGPAIRGLGRPARGVKPAIDLPPPALAHSRSIFALTLAPAICESRAPCRERGSGVIVAAGRTGGSPGREPQSRNYGRRLHETPSIHRDDRRRCGGRGRDCQARDRAIVARAEMATASSFPKSLDTLWGGAETFCKAVAEATDNKFQIQPFAAGEIVPGLAAPMPSATTPSRCAQTASYYFFGKDPTFALACALSVRSEHPHAECVDVPAWRHQADGRLLQEVQIRRAPGRQYHRARWAAGFGRKSRTSRT